MKSSLLALAALLVALPITSLAPGAAAQSLEPPKDDPKTKIEWRGPKFSTGEYIATGTMLAGLGAAVLLTKEETPRWRGGVLVDRQAMALGRGDTPENRQMAANVSDYMLYGMFLWPYADAGVAMARGANTAAWQMALINTESYALTSLVTYALKRTVRRERPYATAECADRPNDPSCGGGVSSASFLSGHASTAFTSAGLVCAHHGAMPLYGSKVADASACIGALAAATVTGSLRVVADVHYASDVFAGAAVGLASGYLLPKLLHYRSSAWQPTDVAKKKPKSGFALASWSAAPMAVPGGAMVTFSGVTF